MRYGNHLGAGLYNVFGEGEQGQSPEGREEAGVRPALLMAVRFNSRCELRIKAGRIEACSKHVRDDFGAQSAARIYCCLTAEELHAATLLNLEADQVLARVFRTRLVRVGWPSS